MERGSVRAWSVECGFELLTAGPGLWTFEVRSRTLNLELPRSQHGTRNTEHLGLPNTANKREESAAQKRCSTRLYVQQSTPQTPHGGDARQKALPLWRCEKPRLSI